MDRRTGLRPLVTGLILLLALAWAPATARAERGVIERAAAADAGRFWTAERLREARPLEVARPDAAARAPAARGVPFVAGPVPDPTVFPSSASGKLFGFQRGCGAFECSATAAAAENRSVVFTAGHCVYDPRAGRWAKRFLFVPAYAHGNEPFGSWSWSLSLVTRQWARRENYNFDFAALSMAPRRGDGALVEDVVGARVLTPNTPREQAYTAVGYPSNRDDGQTMWSCDSSYAGADPRPQRPGSPPMAIGCDMGTGASGGGWFTDAGGLASVSSFGYGRQPVLYGPQLKGKAARLVSRAGRTH